MGETTSYKCHRGGGTDSASTRMVSAERQRQKERDRERERERETERERERERGRQYPRDYFLSLKLRDPTSCGFPPAQGTNKAGHIPEIS